MARILIVDDEKENRDALQLALSDANSGWEILTAKNEREGKDAIVQQLARRF